jgi:4'-phosphopantetheinyl transferase
MIHEPAIWQPPPPHPSISSHEIHIWRASLDLPAALAQRLYAFLAADEQQRAQRLHFDKDRAHFVAARGVLRCILASYLNCAPQKVAFVYGKREKPALSAAIHSPELHFNVSHSHGLALYAVAYQRAVGIDLERIRTNVDYEQIAQRFFSPQEYAILRTLPVNEQCRAFFACWTRKEAYIKAQGDGLWQSLDAFSVTLAPHEPAKLVHTADNPQQAERWSLHNLLPGPDYAAALAAEGHDWKGTCWQWEATVCGDADDGNIRDYGA